MSKYLVLILLFCANFFCQKAYAQISIYLSQGRNLSSFTPSIPLAGEDFGATLTSSTDFVYLNITAKGKHQVSIRKEDSNWDNTLELYIRRTGPGNGNGNGNGGGNNPNSDKYSFIQVTSFDQLFLEGNLSKKDIPLQYEFRNISVLVPAGEHTTTVVYTITDL